MKPSFPDRWLPPPISPLQVAIGLGRFKLCAKSVCSRQDFRVTCLAGSGRKVFEFLSFSKGASGLLANLARTLRSSVA